MTKLLNKEEIDKWEDPHTPTPPLLPPAIYSIIGKFIHKDIIFLVGFYKTVPTKSFTGAGCEVDIMKIKIYETILYEMINKKWYEWQNPPEKQKLNSIREKLKEIMDHLEIKENQKEEDYE